MRPATAALLAALAVPGMPAGAEINVNGKGELMAAVGAAKPGDVLLLADGTYDNVELKISRSGEPGRPIVIEARNPGKAVMKGSTRLLFDGKHVTVSGLLFQGASSRSGGVGGAAVEFTANSEFCRLTQTAVDGYNTGSGSKDNWVSFWGVRNRVDHCSFTGKNREGELLRVRRDPGKSDQHRVDHNYFGPRPGVGGNGGEQIQIGLAETQFSESNTTVDHNLFEECDGEIELISSKSGGNLILFNTVVRCASRLTLRHGNGSRMEGNFVFGGGKGNTGGFRIYGQNHVVTNNFIIQTNGSGDFGGGINLHSGDNADPKSAPKGAVASQNVLVAHNTLVDNKIGIVFGSGKSVAPSNIALANNLIRTASGEIIHAAARLGFSKVEGNLFSGGTLGMPAGAGVSGEDPKLETATLAGFPYARPGTGSPALDKAAGDYAAALAPLKTWLPGEDFGDVGENAFSSGLKPMARSDVGPEWQGGPPKGSETDPILVRPARAARRAAPGKSPGFDALGRIRAPARRLPALAFRP